MKNSISPLYHSMQPVNACLARLRPLQYLIHSMVICEDSKEDYLYCKDRQYKPSEVHMLLDAFEKAMYTVMTMNQEMIKMFHNPEDAELKMFHYATSVCSEVTNLETIFYDVAHPADLDKYECTVGTACNSLCLCGE